MAKCIHGFDYCSWCEEDNVRMDRVSEIYQDVASRDRVAFCGRGGGKTAKIAAELKACGESVVVFREGPEWAHAPETIEAAAKVFPEDPFDDWEDDEKDLADLFPYLLTSTDGTVQGFFDRSAVHKELLRLEQSGCTLVLAPDRGGNTLIEVHRYGKVTAVLTKRST